MLSFELLKSSVFLKTGPLLTKAIVSAQVLILMSWAMSWVTFDVQAAFQRNGQNQLRIARIAIMNIN